MSTPIVGSRTLRNSRTQQQQQPPQQLKKISPTMRRNRESMETKLNLRKCCAVPKCPAEKRAVYAPLNFSFYHYKRGNCAYKWLIWTRAPAPSSIVGPICTSMVLMPRWAPLAMRCVLCGLAALAAQTEKLYDCFTNILRHLNKIVNVCAPMKTSLKQTMRPFFHNFRGTKCELMSFMRSRCLFCSLLFRLLLYSCQFVDVFIQ